MGLHPRRIRRQIDFASAGVWFFGFFAAVAGVIAASALAASPAFYLTAGVVAVVTVAAGALVIAHRGEHDAFSPLGLICLFNVATFGIGAIYFYVAPWPGRLAPYVQSDIAPSVALAALGLVMLTLGYWFNPFKAVQELLPSLPRDDGSRRTLVLLGTLLVIGWLARAYGFATGRYFYSDSSAGPATGASWLILTGTALPLVAAAYCGARYYFAQRTNESYGNARVLFYLLVLIELAYYTPTARRTAILATLMMILVVRYYGLGRRPSLAGLAAVVTLAVVVVFPVLNTYRNTHTGVAYQENLVGNFVIATDSLLHSSPREAVSSGLEATFKRFSGVTSMAAVLHYGPQSLNRQPGETLSWTLTSFLPRAIAPNKPNPGHFGNEFAKEFAIAAPGPVATSIAVPHVTELYLNFRVLGIVFGMLLVGAAYRVIGDYLLGRRTDPLALAIYAAIAWTLINSQEAIIAGGVLGATKVIAVLALAIWLSSALQRLSRRRLIGS